jgi:predicted metal-binding membrane protein
MREVLSERTPHAFFAAAALVFLASAATTVRWCASMSAMPEMPMPGGWTMSMTWMRMPGQSWLGAVASFLVMWTVMMVAMMLPPLMAMLRPRVDGSTALAAAAYFVVWIAIGALLFPLGLTVTSLEMRHPSLARVVPTVAALLIMLAGAVQFTGWKARRLACCRSASSRVDASAWRHGVHLALHCAACCANLMFIVLLLGVMDLRAMTAGTLAIAIERVAGEPAARTIGAVAIATGLFLLA